MYMDKIAVGPRAKGCIDIDAPVSENLERVAKALERKVSDLTVVLLDRERHYGIMDEIRRAGARIQLITDGDVNPIVNAGIEGTGVHMYIGKGGAPEGVLAAAAIKCLGGDMQARLCLKTMNRSNAAWNGHLRLPAGFELGRYGQRRRLHVHCDGYHRKQFAQRSALFRRRVTYTYCFHAL